VHVPRSIPYATVAMVRGRAVIHTWSVDGHGPPDLGVVDDLARVQLMARRFGCSIRLREISADLSALLDLIGLSHLFGSAPLVEVGGKTEGGKKVRVEEAVETDDPIG
jgi:hypothetical protein